MSDARSRILGRLRGALAHDAPGSWPAATADAEPKATPSPLAAAPLTERLTALITAMRAVQTEVHLARSSDWTQRLTAIVASHGVRRLAIGDGPGLPTAAQQALAALQAAPQGPQVLPFNRDIEAWKAELFTTVDAGFTTARCGIADTGGLILWPDATEPRTLSLVPPLHIAWLDGRRVHASLADAIGRDSWTAHGLPTNALLISGPSKTSDIQQTLAYGAHGPRALALIIVVPDDVDLAALAARTGALVNAAGAAA